MSGSLRVVLAQLDLMVGDLAGNAQRVVATATEARDRLDADLVVFPELTLTGYPPEDLLLHEDMPRRVAEALETVRKGCAGIGVLVGFPEYVQGAIHNACALFSDGERLGIYRKQCLPNYAVFDEKRYFRRGTEPCVLDYRGARLALVICEDAWQPGAVAQAAEAGAEIILHINASPFQAGKEAVRQRVMEQRVMEGRLPIVSVNLVGGQDELVFDGGSMVLDATGRVCFRSAPFREGLFPVDLHREKAGGAWQPDVGEVHHDGSLEAAVYEAIVTGIRAYVDKNGFAGVVVGLSGGIDSALTLALATDALGSSRVRAVAMPSRYTSPMSLEDASAQAQALGVSFEEISIEPVFEAVLGRLDPIFAGLAPDATEENLQSRIRGMILMAISNKTGWMVLSTGNKSELAVGYATLYGDMVGGFAPIRDCSKLLVYRLARYRNRLEPEDLPVIPLRVIERPPSAELREDQLDTDSLPPYELLDPILERLVEDQRSVTSVVQEGFDRETVEKIAGLVRINEYKRRQGPPGVRVSRRSFGRDRRYPITSGYRDPEEDGRGT